MSLIKLENVTKVYPNGLKALDSFTFEMDSGEWVSVMGPSGSGKTTLLNLIGVLDRPTSGTVTIDGKQTQSLSDREMTTFRRRTVGLIFQQFHLVPHLTALENVELAQYFHSMVDENQAVELMSRLGLKERLNHLPSQLSGGEQQRVCIARALINEPKILLADEPTGNLDEENEKEILRLLMRLHEEEGLTIVMVTHDLVVGRMADRQIELNHGRLVSATHLVKKIEDDIDDVMEQLWLLRENGNLDPEHVNNGTFKEEVVSHLRSIRLLQMDGRSVSFSPAGEIRARDIIRRHRLGECLFAQTFGLSTAEASDEACQLEHIISQEVAERICTFLGHPQTCPHGHQIPSGRCCQPEQSTP
ncbi:MAG TPA: ATP-binding cassette domain-containing protein [Acidobacteriota bacterium]|nr:ATP-binding cassette domain-containing protein [Acidobacteriota bacterium]